MFFEPTVVVYIALGFWAGRSGCLLGFGFLGFDLCLVFALLGYH